MSTPTPDTGPRWTVDRDGVLRWNEVDEFDGGVSVRWDLEILPRSAYAALLQRVLDAERVPGLEADAATLAKIRALDVSGATYADIGAAVTVILRGDDG